MKDSCSVEMHVLVGFFGRCGGLDGEGRMMYSYLLRQELQVRNPHHYYPLGNGTSFGDE